LSSATILVPEIQRLLIKKLRMNFNYPENVLRITSLNDHHDGHEVSAEFYNRASAKMRKVKLSPTDSLSSNGRVLIIGVRLPETLRCLYFQLRHLLLQPLSRC